LQMRYQPFRDELFKPVQFHTKVQDIGVWQFHTGICSCFVIKVEHDVSRLVSRGGKNDVFCGKTRDFLDGRTDLGWSMDCTHGIKVMMHQLALAGVPVVEYSLDNCRKIAFDPKHVNCIGVDCQ